MPENSMMAAGMLAAAMPNVVWAEEAAPACTAQGVLPPDLAAAAYAARSGWSRST